MVCPSAAGLADCFRDLAQPSGLPDDLVLSAAQLEALSREPLGAALGGNPGGGSRPLVVLAGSIGSRGGEFIELSRRLARRGIVAATLLPAVRDSRPAFTPEEAAAAHAGLQRAIAALTADAGVDGRRLALVAWSFGGVPAALEAMTNPDIRALVSLDSAIRYQYGVDLIRSSAAFRPSAYRGRVLSLAAGTRNAVSQSDAVIDAFTNARLERVIAAGLRHGDFSDLYSALPMRVAGLPDRELDRRREEMLDLVVGFLQRALQ